MLLVPPLLRGSLAQPAPAPPVPTHEDPPRLARRIDRVAAQLTAGEGARAMTRELRRRRATSATIEAYLRERRRI
jgi:hypothetical protein